MPWIGAKVWETFSPQAPFWITAIACAITVPIAWKKFVLPKIETVSPSSDEKNNHRE
jgi:hypothetical protein